MLLAWLLVSGAHAQGVSATSPTNDLDARSWVHESWTVKDGLPVNSINSLLQDRAGYIWAATFDGLVRFDGIRFTVFNSANSGVTATVDTLDKVTAGSCETTVVAVVRTKQARQSVNGR
jgi:ligand-binding sensor domain-containing protein